MNTTPNFLVVGCGDVGKRVAHRLLANNAKISALTHSKASENSLKTLGIEPIFADLDQADSVSAITQSFDNIFYFAPPPSSGQIDSRMQNFIQHYLRQHLPKRIVYISTTGVYGDHSDNWINEETPAKPQVDRSRRRLNAENQIIELAKNTKLEYVIVRVAGIYSLEKLPIERLQENKKILARNLSGASNRIHAEDLADILVAAMLNSKSGEIYNATDGAPSTMSDYFMAVAHTFDLPAPEEVDWQYANAHFSQGMLSYLKESKKISNEKILKQLGIHLNYPDLTTGLKQCQEEYNAIHTNS